MRQYVVKITLWQNVIDSVNTRHLRRKLKQRIKLLEREVRTHRAIGHGGSIQTTKRAVCTLTPPATARSLKQQDGIDLTFREIFRQPFEKRPVVEIDRHVNTNFLPNRIWSSLKDVVPFCEYTFDRSNTYQIPVQAVLHKVR